MKLDGVFLGFLFPGRLTQVAGFRAAGGSVVEVAVASRPLPLAPERQPMLTSQVARYAVGRGAGGGEAPWTPPGGAVLPTQFPLS